LAKLYNSAADVAGHGAGVMHARSVRKRHAS
jgi:hypothetical protein